MASAFQQEIATGLLRKSGRGEGQECLRMSARLPLGIYEKALPLDVEWSRAS